MKTETKQLHATLVLKGINECHGSYVLKMKKKSNSHPVEPEIQNRHKVHPFFLNFSYFLKSLIDFSFGHQNILIMVQF